MDKKERVIVFSGDGKSVIGIGTMVGYEKLVYVFAENDGMSLVNASLEKPSDVIVEEMEKRGYTLVELKDNPRIVMDSGSTLFGCQCWWYKITPEQEEQWQADLNRR